MADNGISLGKWNSRIITNGTLDKYQNSTEQPDIYDVEIDKLYSKIFFNELFYSTVFMFISICIGTTGNVIVVYAFWSNKRQVVSSFFILSLAATDIVNCVFPMPVEIALLINFLKFDHPYLCKASRFVTYACTNMTTGILIAIGVNRYRRIFKPFHAQLNYARAKCVVCLCFVASLVISWPFLFLYGTFTIEIKTNNGVILGKTCLIADSMLNTKYPLYSAVIICVGHLSCDIVLIILYTCIGMSVCKQYMKRRCQDNDNVTQQTREIQLQVLFNALPRHNHDNTGLPADGEVCATKNTMLSNTVNCRNVTFQIERNNHVITNHENEAPPGRRLVERTSIMLFLVTVVFILAYLPFSVLIVLRALNRDFYMRLSNAEKSLYQLFLRFYFLSSVLNPIVYYNISQRFRRKMCRSAKGSPAVI